jgi:hypothetical protein
MSNFCRHLEIGKSVRLYFIAMSIYQLHYAVTTAYCNCYINIAIRVDELGI